MTFAQPFSAYEVIERLGAGSMGTVFKARDKKLGRVVALKVLKPSLARDARYVERLRREARIVASLNHPNIVAGYDLGHEGGYHFFVMECVTGHSLRELLDSWGQFDEERVLEVAIQITTALDHAFKRGVIHRDIKPANVLIDEDNTVKLTDMGLAKGPENLEITRQGATVGTPQYISPEQARDAQDVDVRSDLYSLGATLFHMATGQPPFRAESMGSVLLKVMNERPPSAAGVNPQLSDGLSLVIRKLLSKDPERRYQTPAQLLEDLQRLQRRERPAIDEAELDQEEGEGLSRRTLWMAAAALLLVALALWGVTSLIPPPAVPTAPSSSAIERYEARLHESLHKLSKVGAKLALLESYAATAETDEQRQRIQSIRRVWEQNLLRGALPEFFDAQRAALPEVLRGIPWQQAREAWHLHLRRALQEQHGLGLDQLPAPVRQRYQEGRARLGLDFRRQLRARQLRYRQLLERRIAAVRDDWQDALRSADLPAAEQALQRGVAGVEGLAATLAPGPLDDQLAGVRAEAVAAASRQAGAEIDKREKELQQAFAREMQAELSRLDSRLQEDPRAAAAGLKTLQAELLRAYPENHFRLGRSPWPGAQRRFSGLRRRFGEALRVADRAQLARALRLAMVAMLQGDQSQFGYYSAGLPADLRQPGLVLWRQAGVVRERLLTQLLDGQSRLRLRIPGGRGRQGLQTEVEILPPERPGRGHRIRERGKPQTLARLSVEALWDQLGGTTWTKTWPQPQRDGLALWLLLSGGTRARITGLLDEGQGSLFFRDYLFTAAAGLEVPRDAWSQAQDLLTRARSAVLETGDFVAGQQHVQELRRRFAGFAKEHERELGRLQRAIAKGQARLRAQRAIIARRQDGVRVKVDAELQAEVIYPLRAVGLAALPTGWMLSPDDGLRLHQPADEVGRAWTHALQIDTLLDPQQKECEFVLEFAVEAEADAPRFWMFRCHGAGFGLGLLRDGRIGLVRLSGPRGSLRRRDCQRALRRSLEQPVGRILIGVKHRLRIRVHRAEAGRRATLLLELDPGAAGQVGQTLGRLDVPRDQDAGARFEVAGMARLRLSRLEFRGRPPAGD